ncbi:MAG: alpha/beta hydrolase, partial [Erysipelotrichaceae bacterium]|nr:alpha/beta hydrolase [Erysipelotrichaceae bacterium]
PTGDEITADVEFDAPPTEELEAEVAAFDVLKDKLDIHGEGDKITIAEKGTLDDEDAPKIEVDVTEDESDALESQFHETEGKIDVPYFILDGRLDNNTPASLVQDYYEKLEAPQKDLIWFETAGHNPLGDCPEEFKKAIREKLLPIAEKADCRI